MLNMKIILLLVGIQFYGLHHPRHYGSRAQDVFGVTGLPKRKYVKLGDINIGVLWPMSTRDKDTMVCSDKIDPGLFNSQPDVVAYAVELFNKNHPLPNNLTLGFVFLDDCEDLTGAVYQTLSFVRTICPAASKNSPSQGQAAQAEVWYDVVAVVCCYTSHQSVAVARTFGAVQMPQISVSSTSDELSDKDYFPYFLRVVSADKSQYYVILALLQKNRWTYVSLIYTEGSYGENGFQTLEKLFDENKICIVTSHKVTVALPVEEATHTADSFLERRGNARVVILIVISDQAYKIISAVQQKDPNPSLLWIGTDGWANAVSTWTDLAPSLLGSVTVNFEYRDLPGFDDWFRQLTPNTTSNTWFTDNWQNFFNCSFAKGTCGPNLTFINASLPVDKLQGHRGYLADAVFMIGNATSRILKRPDCQNLRGSAARDCVTGPRLLEELKITHQNGYSGKIQLDANGDRLGSFSVMQLLPGSIHRFQEVRVTDFDFKSDQIRYIHNFSWAHHKLYPGFDRLESQCSYPCDRYEARQLMGKFGCCWKCLVCHNYEYLSDNGTACKDCPELQWPDSDTRKTCVDIRPKTLDFTSPIGIIKAVLVVLCICVCMYVFVFFHLHRDHRVIKACSIQLSYIMLFAIALGYLTVMIFMAHPTNASCRIGFWLLVMSFAMIYGPLLVRTLWVYRLFRASKKTRLRPRLTSRRAQVVISVVIVALPVIMGMLPLVKYPKWHKMSAPLRQERYVEHTCDFPYESMLSFLIYTVTLVASCGWLAYKTRHLPDAFNESRFITICVCTTLAISFGFIPTYLAANKDLVKIIIIGVFVFLNHSITLAFLFLTKVYAVLYVFKGYKTATSSQQEPGRWLGLNRKIPQSTTLASMLTSNIHTSLNSNK